MSELRVAKASELIKQEMSQMLLYEVKDPRIGFVTITDVTMTKDLREATVYVSIMGKDKEIEDTWEGIQSALPYLRREIGRRVRLRFTPSISFALDKSLDYSEHIQKLLLKVERGETND